jgi:hypothetical protein
MLWGESHNCETVEEERRRAASLAKAAIREANEEYLRQHTKRCPNKKCQRRVEKNKGC